VVQGVVSATGRVTVNAATTRFVQTQPSSLPPAASPDQPQQEHSVE
jgi:hypothetical protein